MLLILRASCLKLEINECGCYETKIEAAGLFHFPLFSPHNIQNQELMLLCIAYLIVRLTPSLSSSLSSSLPPPSLLPPSLPSSFLSFLPPSLSPSLPLLQVGFFRRKKHEEIKQRREELQNLNASTENIIDAEQPPAQN